MNLETENYIYTIPGSSRPVGYIEGTCPEWTADDGNSFEKLLQSMPREIGAVATIEYFSNLCKDCDHKECAGLIAIAPDKKIEMEVTYA